LLRLLSVFLHASRFSIDTMAVNTRSHTIRQERRKLLLELRLKRVMKNQHDNRKEAKAKATFARVAARVANGGIPPLSVPLLQLFDATGFSSPAMRSLFPKSDYSK
jgi:hypothetical protein